MSASFKGSLDPSHFIFEINVGKGRIRHRTILNLGQSSLSRWRYELFFKNQSRSMSDPTLSDIYFKNEMAWV